MLGALCARAGPAPHVGRGEIAPVSSGREIPQKHRCGQRGKQYPDRVLRGSHTWTLTFRGRTGKEGCRRLQWAAEAGISEELPPLLTTFFDSPSDSLFRRRFDKEWGADLGGPPKGRVVISVLPVGGRAGVSCSPTPALGGPARKAWSRMLYQIVDGQGRQEGCPKKGRQEGSLF